MLAALKLFGHQALFPVPDIDRTQFFLCLGGNPMASNGSLMTAPGFRHRLRELQERGGRFVVVDPRRTESGNVADQHLFIRPGTDAWLLLAPTARPRVVRCSPPRARSAARMIGGCYDR
jgi:anaerobic selenocysteine-containing dehydrogenase